MEEMLLGVVFTVAMSSGSGRASGLLGPVGCLNFKAVAEGLLFQVAYSDD